jgi:hypothetical protein
MIDKLKKNPFISVIIVCSIIIPMAVSVTVWFYERQLANIISKYEADKANIKNTYEAKVKILEIEIKQLKSKSSKKQTSIPGNIKQETKGHQSPAVISNDNVDIKINEK